MFFFIILPLNLPYFARVLSFNRNDFTTNYQETIEHYVFEYYRFGSTTHSCVWEIRAIISTITWMKLEIQTNIRERDRVFLCVHREHVLWHVTHHITNNTQMDFRNLSKYGFGRYLCDSVKIDGRFCILKSWRPLKGSHWCRVVLFIVILVSMTIVCDHCRQSMIVIIVDVVQLSSALLMMLLLGMHHLEPSIADGCLWFLKTREGMFHTPSRCNGC